jgi:hypothetical protein
VVDVRRGSRKDKEAKAMKRKIRKKRWPRLTSTNDINGTGLRRTCIPGHGLRHRRTPRPDRALIELLKRVSHVRILQWAKDRGPAQEGFPSRAGPSSCSRRSATVRSRSPVRLPALRPDEDVSVAEARRRQD